MGDEVIFTPDMVMFTRTNDPDKNLKLEFYSLVATAKHLKTKYIKMKQEFVENFRGKPKWEFNSDSEIFYDDIPIVICNDISNLFEFVCFYDERKIKGVVLHEDVFHDKRPENPFYFKI